MFLSLFSVLILTAGTTMGKGVPMIIETDIGQFMDDAWALTLLLKDPLIDIRLIVTSTNNTVLRAQTVAKLCAAAGRSDIPIAIGERTSDYAGAQTYWAASYNLSAHPGPIIRSGAASAVVSVLKEALLAGERVRLVELSPPVVFAAVAQAHPNLFAAAVAQAEFMAGCFKFGYGHTPGQTAEYNARFIIPATDALLHARLAGCRLRLTPLDTGAQVVVKGDNYQRVLAASKQDSLLSALIESFRVWWKMCPLDPLGIMCPPTDPDGYTGSLFDMQSAAFASSYAGSLIKYVVVEENQPVAINATGFTNIVPEGSPTDIFMSWDDLPGFMSVVTDILTNTTKIKSVTRQ